MVVYLVAIKRHGKPEQIKPFAARTTAESWLRGMRFKKFRASVSGSRQTWTRDTAVASVALRLLG